MYNKSLLLFFFSLLQSINVFSQTSTVVHAGIGGNSSQQMLNRIDSDVLAYNPETTIMLAGTNDMLNSGKSITLSDFESNLRSMIDKILAVNSELILMTIPPCIEEKLFERHDEAFYEPEGPNGRVDLANAIVNQVATEYNLVLLDINEIINNNISLLSSDGVHPTTTGYSTISNLIYDAIEDNCYPTGVVACFGNSITRGYTTIFEDKLTNNPIDCDNPTTCGPIIANTQINAENFCDSLGINTNSASEGGSYIGGIQSGDYLSYGLFNFDENTVNAIEVAIGKSSTKDTFLEVRLDSSTGTLIGTVDASETTGGSQNWMTRLGTLDDVSGEHEVFLVFTGQSGVTLVNFNWFRFFNSSLSIDENKISFINAYPNPVIDKLIIRSNEDLSFEIYNSIGQLKHKALLISNQHTLDMSTFSSGIYFIKVFNSKGVEIKKIVKR